MKKFFTIVLFILLAFFISLAVPYLLVFLKNSLESCLDIDDKLLPNINYIPMLTSLFTFLATITISYSVYSSNKKKSLNEDKEKAFEFTTFLEYSISNIENYREKLSDIDLEEKPQDYVKMAYRFELSNKQINTLNKIILDIRDIARESDNKSLDSKYDEFIKKEDALDECRKIIKFLLKKYKLGINN